MKKSFTSEEAKVIGEELGIKWEKFNVEQFRKGMDIELLCTKCDMGRLCKKEGHEGKLTVYCLEGIFTKK